MLLRQLCLCISDSQLSLLYILEEGGTSESGQLQGLSETILNCLWAQQDSMKDELFPSPFT